MVFVFKFERTTNYAGSDPIFPDLSPFLFQNIVDYSTFVEDSFEWPRMFLGIST